ncbi:MAG TPA: DUF488 family protein [Sphingobacteriaceae bacterium]
MILIKRIYEPAEEGDGFRVLIDRLWPRGIKKETAQLDMWLKDVAPSTALRKWIHSEPGEWKTFEKLYMDELAENEGVAVLSELISKHKKVTLLYAAKDNAQNHAVVLERFLKRELG